MFGVVKRVGWSLWEQYVIVVDEVDGIDRLSSFGKLMLKMWS